VSAPGKLKIAVILFAAFVIGFLSLPACWAFSGKVVDVLGGDVLLVSVDGGTQKIRLYGIACPVFGQPFYDKARFLANHLSLQRNVEVTPVFTDSDGMVNALVRIEGVADYLNNQLVGYGMAWVKPCDSKSRLCGVWKKQEEFAQMNFIGLWAHPPAIPPWDWKKAERMQIYEQSREQSKPQK
jgi:endonuclease YncB( thermonuclease family)